MFTMLAPAVVPVNWSRGVVAVVLPDPTNRSSSSPTVNVLPWNGTFDDELSIRGHQEIIPQCFRGYQP